MNGKSLLQKLSVLSFFTLLLTTQMYAQFSLSGEVRPRMEYRHGYSTLTNKDSDPAGFTSQRTRINFGYAKDNVKLGISLQDVFLWGSQPQLFKTSNTVSLHQAWGQVFLTDNFSIKVGRQELVYDDQRIFGNSNWTQQGRSHDVLLLKYGGRMFLDVGIAYNQSEERLNGSYYDLRNNYKTMQFVWFNTPLTRNMKLSLLFLNNGYQHDYIENVDDTPKEKTKNVFNQTVGGRLTFTPDTWMFHAAAYYTMGKDTADRDLSAYYVGLGIDKAVSNDWNIGLGWELLSGTSQKDVIDDPQNYKNRSFNPFYTTAHKFNGYMDYFNTNGDFANSVGLNDIFAYIQYSRKRCELNLTAHGFMSAATVIENGTTDKTMDSFLGVELDLTMSYRISNSSSVVMGYSQMFGTKTLQNLKGGDHNACNNWAYVMFVFKPVFIK